MNLKYLAIERDMAFHDRESRFWLSRGVGSIRVSSMTEGIEEAMKHKFLYIGINAANINYQPQLPLLRDATNDPIFISTTTYTMQEQGIAISLGADLFGQIGEYPEDNYSVVMQNINALEERANRRKNTDGIFVHGDIVVSVHRHIAFIKGEKIQLSDTEIKILRCIVSKRGQIISHTDLYHEIYNSEYDKETSSEILYSTMKRLRRKIRDVIPHDCIETVWDAGYRLKAEIDLK